MNGEGNTMVEDKHQNSLATHTTTAELNVIQPYGYSVSKCGYCKGSRSKLLQSLDPPISQVVEDVGSSTSVLSSTIASNSSLSSKSYSVLAESISPTLYEELISRGWRRSGVHLYKPQNFSSCCPALTTRLLTREFQPTKSQRKVLKKMDNILKSPLLRKDGMIAATTTSTTPISTTKKQKRNHQEKRKTDYSTKSIRILSEYGNCGNIGIERGKMTVSCAPLVVKLMATGFLQRLEEITIKAIDKYLLEDSVLSYSREKFKQDQDSCKLKTSYRILSPSKREQTQSRIRAISTICAQVSGRFSSTPSTIQTSRKHLARQVAHFMKEDEEVALYSANNSNGATATSPNNCAFSVISIDAHQESGQIICIIEWNGREYDGDEKSPSGTDENESDEIGIYMDTSDKDRKDDSNFVGCNIGGKLERWYHATTGKRLELDSNQHRMTIETLPAHQSALNPEVHRLYTRYQHKVHNDPDPFSDDPNISKINVNDDDEQKLETDDPSELDWGHAPTYFADKVSSMLNTYIGSFQSKDNRQALLSNYYSYYQFLVESPFPLAAITDNKTTWTDEKSNAVKAQQIHSLTKSEESRMPCGLYHQHYRLGGEILIAVGVIDVLPTGLSSVYLFYDPYFSHELVALGKYAILKEIEFARDTLRVPYYYLGYYIESCQKMRYKAEYKPSQMLCPVHYDWVDATKAIAKLRKTPRHVCPLLEATSTCGNENNRDCRATGKQEENNSKPTKDIADAIKTLQMDIGAAIYVTIDMLQPNGVEVVKPILEEFITEFSPELSRKCLLKLN